MPLQYRTLAYLFMYKICHRDKSFLCAGAFNELAPLFLCGGVYLYLYNINFECDRILADEIKQVSFHLAH